MSEIFTDPFKTLDYNRVMLYGHVGVGKTHMVGTAIKTIPDGKFLVYIDFQGGWRTLLNVVGSEVFRAKVRYACPRNFSEVNQCLAMIGLKAQQGVVGLVVVDNVTIMQRILMGEIKMTKVDSSKGVVVVPSQNPSQADWGVLISRVMEVCTFVVNLHCNAIFVALVNDKSENTSIKPSMQGVSTADDVSAMCDVVLYLTKKDEVDEHGKPSTKRFCYAAPVASWGDRPIIARDQNGVLEPIIEPNFAFIFEQIKNKHKTL